MDFLLGATLTAAWLGFIGTNVQALGQSALLDRQPIEVTEPTDPQTTDFQPTSEGHDPTNHAEVSEMDQEAFEQEAFEQAPPVIVVEPDELDGELYEVTDIELVYDRDHPGQPEIEAFRDVAVNLVYTDSGYVGMVSTDPQQERDAGSVEARESTAAPIILSSFPQLPTHEFYQSAINQICRAVLAEFNQRGFIGVFVSPHPDDIDEDGEDLRDGTVLRIVIETSAVSELRTLGTGQRVDVSDRINNPIHASIKQRSPIQPPAEEGQEGDLLHKDLLERYIYRLNRHPGRRVSVAVSAGQDPGGVALDYLISENKPWLTYFQISNTGTQQTDELRERFGFIHNQLTGHDDILSVDFLTANFDETNALIASYDAPVFGHDYLRWNVYGSWNEFTASDVGQTGINFEGESWTAGGELNLNIFQHREWFVDFFGGVTWHHIEVEQVGSPRGKDDFFIPHLGVSLERFTEVSSTQGQVRVEWNAPSIADTDPDGDDIDSGELGQLGRESPDNDWTLLRWDLSQSFYLEPLLNREAWEDASTPDSSTLAHEMSISFKGQYVFSDRRVIPQMERVVGGFYSVRGYEESATAGDTAFILNIEYRFHLPRIFKIQPDPSQTPLFGQPFRLSPQQIFGRPDWDLIFRGFVDLGHTQINGTGNDVDDQTLMGAGGGVEFLFKQNLSVRFDWGVALRDANEVTSGSNQIHFVATVLY